MKKILTLSLLGLLAFNACDGIIPVESESVSKDNPRGIFSSTGKWDVYTLDGRVFRINAVTAIKGFENTKKDYYVIESFLENDIDRIIKVLNANGVPTFNKVYGWFFLECSVNVRKGVIKKFEYRGHS